MKKIIFVICALLMLTGCSRKIGGNEHVVMEVKRLGHTATGGFVYKVTIQTTNDAWQRLTLIETRKFLFTNKLYVVGDTIHIK